MAVENQAPTSRGVATGAAARREVPRRSVTWGKRTRLVRHVLQTVVVAYIGWLIISRAASGGSSAESLCPFGGFETLWTWITTGRTVAHTHPANLVLALAITVMALSARGSFCGWLCPLGAIQEGLYGVARAVGRAIRPLGRWQRRPAGPGWRKVDAVLRQGRWVVLAFALGGAALTGTMVFRNVDPWSALLSIVEFELSLAFVVLAAMLVLSFVVPRPFCRYACPLGAVQGLIAKASPVAVQRDADACLGCDLCTRACPMALQVDQSTRITDAQCIGCLECVAACPSQQALGISIALPWPSSRSLGLPADHDEELVR
ncbi:MAG TPA: 4Fe-4S binding protein [Candidatus Nanopelagicales bacterium]